MRVSSTSTSTSTSRIANESVATEGFVSRLFVLVLVLVLGSFVPRYALAGEAEIQRDIKYLASDELEGRATGSPGAKKAADYICEQLKAAGLEPKRVPFEFLAGIARGEKTALALEAGGDAVATGKDDFSPLGFSANGEAAGEVVFCGYGITATDAHFDEYAGVDVKGKVALVLDRVPHPASGTARADVFGHDAILRFGQVRYKAMNAREHGAAGMLVVSADRSKGREDDASLIPLAGGVNSGDAGIVCADLRRSVAAALVARAGRSLDALEAAIDADTAPHSATLTGIAARLVVDLVREKRQAENVVAVRLGGTGASEGGSTADEALRDQAIVVGAHFDHLGRGEVGGSLAEHPEGQIHHGADDNASGVAALLEVARTLPRTRRSVVFCAFSGEEMGLLGSAAYVKEAAEASAAGSRTPGAPATAGSGAALVGLDRTVAMVNMDMVGRLGAKKLTVGGMGTAAEWKTLVPACAEKAGIGFAGEEDGYGPSDHSSFYGKGVPVLFLFTGAHADYHKPSDTWEKIDYPGEAKVVAFARALVEAIDALAAPPIAKTAAGNPHGGELEPGRGPQVYLGTIPDYSETDEPGVRLTGVRDGSPAEKAGLKGGDVIVRFDGHEIRDVHDYTYALFAKKPGDPVEVVVKRGAEKVTLHATMGRRGGPAAK